MKSGVVIQARLGSTRLPGKVLLPVQGATLLERCATRAAHSRCADLVVVATTDDPLDDAVEWEAARLGLACVRGSQDDVLSRYRLAAAAHGLDVVCRITSDCPFIDPEIVDAVFELFFDGNYDYASNSLRRTYPRGLDAEVFSARALNQADRLAGDPAEREHVTPYIYGHPEIFSLGSLEREEDLSHLRWTVDEPDDLHFATEIAKRLPTTGRTIGYREILRLLDREPELAQINAHVEQKRT